jgi:hypothetical protein
MVNVIQSAKNDCNQSPRYSEWQVHQMTQIQLRNCIPPNDEKMFQYAVQMYAVSVPSAKVQYYLYL